MISAAQYLEWLQAEDAQRVLLVEAIGYDPVPPVGAGTLEGTTNLIPTNRTLTASIADWTTGRWPAGSYDADDLVLFDAEIGAMKVQKRPGTNTQTFGVRTMNCTALTQYTYSADIFATEINSAYLDIYDGVAWHTIAHPGDGQWHRISATFTTIAGKVTLQPRLGVYSTGTRDAWFKNAQIEQKSYATAFVDGVRPTQGYANCYYLASAPFISRPTDTPANQPYEDVVIDIPRFACALSDALEGYTIPSWGDILVNNAECSRDAWLGYGWDGRAITLLFGDPSWSRADFRVILPGTIAGISAPAPDTIKISIRDNQWQLNSPIQDHLLGTPQLLAGTTYKISDSPVTTIDAIWDNGALLDPEDYTISPATSPATFTLAAPPVGFLTVEFSGGPAAVGQVIPLCYGEVFNITPLLLSAPLLKYQVHDGPISAILEVRDAGVPVAFTPDLAAGGFSLLSRPVGAITCDVHGATDNGVFVEGTGRIARHILMTRAGWSATAINTDSLRTFINTCPQRVGLYVSDRRNTLDVLDELMKGVGGWYTPDRAGLMAFGRIDVPAGEPVLELTGDDLFFGSLRIVKQSTPLETVRLAYLRNYTPQSATHGAVSDADRALYSQQWRYLSRSNPAIRTAHLLASRPGARPTTLVDRLEAGTESDRQLALNGVVRTTYSADCITRPLTLNLGDIVRLTHPRYGLENGKLLYVVGINEKNTNRRVTLTLWG